MFDELPASVGLYFLRGRHAGKRALAAQGTYLPTSFPYKETVTKLHPYMRTHAPTYPPTTHRHPPEVVPDVVPCASRIFKVFYKAFFATFGGILSRQIGGKGPENVDLEQFLCV